MTPLAHAVRFAMRCGITNPTDLATELECTLSAVYRALKQLKGTDHTVNKSDCTVTDTDRAVKSDRTELTERSQTDPVVTKSDRTVSPEPRVRARIETPSGLLYANGLSKNNNTHSAVTDSAASARAPQPPGAGCQSELSEIQSAFNSATESMLREVEQAMGAQADRPSAARWLASMLQVNGAEAMSQAFAMLATKRAEGVPIARVLPWWSKTAATLKANPPAPKQPKKLSWIEMAEKNERWWRESGGLEGIEYAETNRNVV